MHSILGYKTVGGVENFPQTPEFGFPTWIHAKISLADSQSQQCVPPHMKDCHNTVYVFAAM